MIRARKEGRTEEALIADMSQAHQRDFAHFQIEFDHYGSTNSEANRQLCHQFWKAMREAGLIVERSIQQLYDPEAQTFLADRFVRGTCPSCGREDQPGDSCVCGHTYSPTELINPKSTLSGATPILKDALHLFVELEKLHDIPRELDFDQRSLAQPETANYLKGHFLTDALRDWDISRPAPYFGFEIPDAPGNYWYVWFDAPIGYIASTKQWCDASGEQLMIGGKAIAARCITSSAKTSPTFHTLFWPGMLHTAGFSLPTKVHIHGFLNVNGEKMSKSTGTLISAETLL